MSNRRSINLWGLIATRPPTPDPLAEQRNTLVDYFRGDGYPRYGFDGDERGLTYAQCAVKWLREFDAFLGTFEGNAAYIKYLYTLTPAGQYEIAEARKSPSMCDALWGTPTRPTSIRCPLCGWLKADHS